MDFLPQLGEDDEEDDVTPMAPAPVVEDDGDDVTSSSRSVGIGYLEKVREMASREAVRMTALANSEK